MKKAVIIGASGFGKEVLSFLKEDKNFEIMGFIDANLNLKGININGVNVLGDDSSLYRLKDEGIKNIFVAISDHKIRLRIAELCLGLGYELPILIHSSAIVDSTATLGKGTIVYPGAIINTNAQIGDNVLINTNATIGHDVVIGNGVNINPGVNIGGNVHLKRGAYMGIGASTTQKVTIGSNSIIGAGAIVINDVPDNVTAVGVPAKIIKENNINSSEMLKEIIVGNKKVGDGHPIFICAEAGVNHEGDIEIAKKLVDEAVTAGADAVKFQSFKAEKLNTRNAPKAQYHIETTGADGSWFDLLKKEELTEEMHQILFDYCKEKGIIFLSTPYDEDSADLLDQLGVPAFKIASTDLTNTPLLEHIAKKQKPIFLPTAMSSYAEIEEAINSIRKHGNNQIVVLQCTGNYPAEIKNANLNVMQEIRRKFNVLVGYSDHTPTDVLPIAATVHGSCFHEKHFTLDKTMEGPDHRASIEPLELRSMVKHIRLAEQCMGSINNKPCEDEKINILRLRKSVVAKSDIPAGSVITREMITTKRPGTGLHPRHAYDFVGKIACREIKEDELLAYTMVADN